MAVTYEIVDQLPETREAFGVQDPTRAGRAFPVKEEAIRCDAVKAGLTVTKLLGRLTVMQNASEVPNGGSPRLYCFRISKSGERLALSRRAARGEDIDPLKYRCKQGAGEGTLHAGSGACSFHGGSNYGRHFKGIRTNSRRQSLTRYDVANALLGNDEGGLAKRMMEQLDIVDELILQRQMLNQYLNDSCLDEDGRIMSVVPGSVVAKAMKWSGDVTATVERAKRIENESALTRAHVLYLISVLSDLSKTYVPVEQQKEYADELLSAFGLDPAGVQSLLEPSDSDVIGELVAR